MTLFDETRQGQQTVQHATTSVTLNADQRQEADEIGKPVRSSRRRRLKATFVKRFIQAYKQALDYVKSHHDTAVNLFVQKNKLTPEVAELTLSRRNYLISAPTPDYTADLVEQSKLLKQFGVLQTEPDWSTVVDTSIANQALGIA